MSSWSPSTLQAFRQTFNATSGPAYPSRENQSCIALRDKEAWRLLLLDLFPSPAFHITSHPTPNVDDDDPGREGPDDETQVLIVHNSASSDVPVFFLVLLPPIDANNNTPAPDDIVQRQIRSLIKYQVSTSHNGSQSPPSRKNGAAKNRSKPWMPHQSSIPPPSSPTSVRLFGIATTFATTATPSEAVPSANTKYTIYRSFPSLPRPLPRHVEVETRLRRDPLTHSRGRSSGDEDEIGVVVSRDSDFEEYDVCDEMGEGKLRMIAGGIEHELFSAGVGR